MISKLGRKTGREKIGERAWLAMLPFDNNVGKRQIYQD